MDLSCSPETPNTITNTADYAGQCFKLPGLLEVSEGGEVRGNSHIHSKHILISAQYQHTWRLVRLVSLQRIVEEWQSRVIGKASILVDRCSGCGYRRVGIWPPFPPKIASFLSLDGQWHVYFSYLHCRVVDFYPIFLVRINHLN